MQQKKQPKIVSSFQPLAFFAVRPTLQLLPPLLGLL
jgi:hypothetical protein